MSDETFGARFGLIASIPAPIGVAYLLSGFTDLQRALDSAGPIRISLAAVSVVAGMLLCFWIGHAMGRLILRRTGSDGILQSLVWGALTGLLMALAVGLSMGLPSAILTGHPGALLASLVLGLLGLWMFLPYGVLAGGLLRLLVLIKLV